MFFSNKYYHWLQLPFHTHDKNMFCWLIKLQCFDSQTLMTATHLSRIWNGIWLASSKPLHKFHSRLWLVQNVLKGYPRVLERDWPQFLRCEPISSLIRVSFLIGEKALSSALWDQCTILDDKGAKYKSHVLIIIIDVVSAFHKYYLHFNLKDLCDSIEFC